MLIVALTTLFVLVLVQVLFLFRVADAARRWLRTFIPERKGVLREVVAGLLFVAMVILVVGVYLFGPAYLTTLAFASALSVPSSELGKYVPVFLLISLIALGECGKRWPSRFAAGARRSDVNKRPHNQA